MKQLCTPLITHAPAQYGLSWQVQELSWSLENANRLVYNNLRVFYSTKGIYSFQWSLLPVESKK